MWTELKEGVTPKDKEYQVMDENKNVAFAKPAYFPFKVGPRTGGRYTEKITHCAPYWDGSWIVIVRGGRLTSNLTGKVTHFREILN